MPKERRKTKGPWPWSWTWQRHPSRSVFLWSGLGQRTSASQEIFCECCVGTSSTRGGCSFEGCAAEPLTTITPILLGSKWSCLLLHIVLQDALSEVTKFDPPMKLRVFVDAITALLMVKNREVAEMARKVMKKLKEEVERTGLILSVTKDGKEGQSKMIASCCFLENELRQFSKEGVALAESVETLGVDLRTRVKSWERKKTRGGRSAR